MWYGMMDIVQQMRRSLPPDRKLREGEFWALHDVSFSVRGGEMVGIVGPNGSGKTTLLKLLNGILLPDEGKIRVQGSVGALITIGAGFHPLLTGRENIYISAALLNLSRSEIDERFDEIVEFADIGDFLDMPVKNYSSGMFVRLGFAIAACCEVDILLVDEVLSVGDLSFQNKCLQKLALMRRNSKTIIFVSHNLEHIRSLCNRIIVLDEGKVVYIGNTYDGLLHYHELMRDRKVAKGTPGASIPFIFHQTSGDIIFGNAGILDPMGNPTKQVVMGEPIITFFEFEVPSSISCFHFTVGIRNDRGQNCIVHVSSDRDKNHVFEDITEGKYRLTVKFNVPNLVPGVYYPVIAIRNGQTQETYERLRDVTPFAVVGNILPRGIVHTESEWELNRIA